MSDGPAARSDEALMAAYAQGDAAAFDHLFARYERRAYAFFLQRVQSPDRASDLFQELFLRIHRSRETFRPEGRFGAWFYQIAHNVLVDDFRRRGPTLEGLGEDLASGDARSPEADAEQAEALGALLGALTDEEQAILVAAKGAGVDLGTIARSLGRTTVAVRQILSRARRRIRARHSDAASRDGDG